MQSDGGHVYHDQGTLSHDRTRHSDLMSGCNGASTTSLGATELYFFLSSFLGSMLYPRSRNRDVRDDLSEAMSASRAAGVVTSPPPLATLIAGLPRSRRLSPSPRHLLSTRQRAWTEAIRTILQEYHIYNFATMKLLPSLPANLAEWAERQPVFFTGSAATHGRHINVSPKGLTSHFAVLGPNRCAYIDRTGSGCETISHSYENGRLCLMFMSFGDTPRIMRLFCQSTVVEWDQPQFQELVTTISKGKRDAFDGARAVIVCDIWEVQTSCGYGVPRVKKALYRPGDEEGSSLQPAFEDILRQGKEDGSRLDELAVFEERPTLDKWAGGKVEENKIQDYHLQNNLYSMDGLPGLRTARRDVGQKLFVVDLTARAKRVAAEGEALMVGFAAATLLVSGLWWLGLIQVTT